MHASHRSPYPPLDGTIRSPRGLFVDRWGTLLETPAAGYARSPEEIRFHAGAIDALFRATRAGWLLYLVGNEESVAFGQLAKEAWEENERRILDELRGAGVVVTRNYACLEHPRGIAGRRNDSVYLLPNTGAFYHAVHTDGIELAKSWVIGDSTLELVAGWRAGVRMASVRTGQALADRTFEVDPELTGANLRSVLLELLARTEALHP